MQIEFKFFRNKVARRMFLLFIVSTFIPVLFLLIFQLVQVNRQINESSELQVRQDVKNLGMILIGRLFQIENQLGLLGRALNALPESSIPVSVDIEQLTPDIESLSLIKESGEAIIFKGKKLKIPRHPPKINTGESWLTIEQDPINKTKILLMYQLNAAQVLVGTIKPLGNFDLNSDSLLWIIDASGQVIYSSNNTIPLPLEFTQYKQHYDTGTFPWKIGNTPYYVGFWNLFLRQRLHSGNWIMVLAEPKSTIFMAAKELYRIILPTLLLALLLSILLSQAQIRRSLIPLEQLREATGRIAKRDFTVPVQVHSGDEFQELADSFNAMSKRIYQQLQTLSVMSILDQTILSTQDGESVLRIIFSNLKELVDYDVLALGILQRDQPNTLLLLVDFPHDKSLEPKFLTITETEIIELRQQDEILLNLNETKMPGYLSVFKTHAMQFALMFPIHHHNEPEAVICLGFKTQALLNRCNTKDLHDVFYRGAVAYTHAEWEERLYRQAHFDDLTNLPNRLVLRDRMHQAMERASINNHFCVLMFIDLDNFKDINDTLGHAVGDQLLECVARSMQQAVGHLGTLARIGGDEFTLLMTDIPELDQAKHEATVAAEALLATFTKPFNLEDLEYNATASMGIVIYPDDCETSDELLKFADMSMYKAKQSGKNRYVFFSQELGVVVRKRNQLLQELHYAILQHQFVVYFQPKIDARTKQLVGAEALLRWQHPKRGLLPPDVFLNLAEETNIIFLVGEFVVRATCEQIVAWQKQGVEVKPIAINIAAKQFTQNNLGAWIQQTLSEYQIDPHLVEFEVTESALIENFDQTNLIMQQIHQLGCRLAIDDFGTGYSSMRYLRMLPLQIMKIDRAFVNGIPEDQHNLSIIKAMVTLAKNLEMDLVVEGIETAEQAELLEKMGCYVHQGYFYSEPLTSTEFTLRFLTKEQLNHNSHP